MMKTTCLLSLLAAPILSAGTFDPGTIPADAKWFIHGDLETLRESMTGKIMIAEVNDKHASVISEVETIFGFNVISDLTDVTLLGDGKRDHVALMLNGKIGRGHLEGVLVGADDYDTADHEGTVIHSWSDNGKAQFTAFHGQDTLIFSEKIEMVEFSLDALAKRSPTLKMEAPSPSDNPLFIAMADVEGLELPDDDGSKIVRKAETISMTLTEKGDRLKMDLNVRAESELIASRIKNVLEGLVSLGALADDKVAALDVKHSGSVSGSKMKMSMDVSIMKALALLSEL